MDQARDAVARGGGLDRRVFLRRALALPLIDAAARGRSAAGAMGQADGTEDHRPLAGMITRQKHPDNLEFPFWTLDDFLTPNDSSTSAPISRSRSSTRRPGGCRSRGRSSGRWSSATTSCGRCPRRRSRPCWSARATAGCFSNRRSRHPLGAGGVGTAEWTGVPLSAVLDRAGVKPGAVEVVLEGADKGEFREPDAEDARRDPLRPQPAAGEGPPPEVLLAYKMNGEDLPPAHGFPSGRWCRAGTGWPRSSG